MYPPFMYREPTDLFPPLMPTGLNSTVVSGDEFNGGGVNDELWTYLFDSSTVFKPIVITDELINNFETDHADVVIRDPAWQINIPREFEILTVRQRA